MEVLSEEINSGCYVNDAGFCDLEELDEDVVGEEPL